MIVLLLGSLGSHVNQLAGHTKMKKPDIFLFQINQNVFRSPPNIHDGLSPQPSRQADIDGMTQARLKYSHTKDAAALQMRSQSAANSFPFRQFRHAVTTRSWPQAAAPAASTNAQV